MVSQLLLLSVLIVIGYIVTKIGFVDEVGSNKISSFISRVTMPAMYIATFMGQDFSATKMRQSGILLAISGLYYIIALSVSFLFVKLTKPPSEDRGVFQFLLVFSNAAYMGFPVLSAVFGKDAIFYGAFFNIPFNILAFSLGIFLLTRGQKGPKIKKREMFLHPGTLSAVFGALLYIISPFIEGTVFHNVIYRSFLYKGLDLLGSTTIPLSMIVIGSVLATLKLSAVFTNWRVYLLSAVRLLVLPALMLLALLPFNLEPIIRGIPVLIAGMPGAVFCVILAKEYGGEKTASIGVFLSTLFSALTIPFIASWL